MKGSVLKRGSRWVAIYDEERGGDGKRRQRWKGGFATKKAAQEFLATTLHKIGEGTYVQPSRVPLIDFLTVEWLPAVEQEVRPLSYVAYEKAVRLHIGSRPWLARLPLQAVTPTHVRRLMSELATDGKAASTRRFVRAVLGRAFADALEDRRVAQNPVAASRRRRERGQAKSEPGSHTKVSVWTAREVNTFLKHVAVDRLAALWRLAATTGMRRGELLGLTWRTLDLERGSLTVEQQLVPTPGGATFGPPKTERSRRTIALDAETVVALRVHRETQLLERALMADSYQDLDLVFCREDGSSIHPQRLTEGFAAHRKASGLPAMKLHGLRHTHATLGLSHGVPIHVVAARLGDRPEEVLRTYAHLLPKTDEEAARNVALVLAAAAGR